jgi:hypothetical protein
MYESGQCREDLKFLAEEKFNRPALDNQVFDAYTSTDMRSVLQEKRLRIPAKLKWMLLLVCFLAAFIYYMMHKNSLFHSDVKTGLTPAIGSSLAPVLPTSTTSQKQDDDILKTSSFPEILPKDNLYPEFAKVSRLPISCVSGHDACVCYDQQMQKMVDLPRFRCQSIVDGANPVAVAYSRPLYSQNQVNPDTTGQVVTAGQGGGVGVGEAAAPPSSSPPLVGYPDSMHVNGVSTNTNYL